MPKGRGCKGGAAPPKKKPKVTVTSTERVPFSTVCRLSGGPNEAGTPLDSSSSDYAGGTSQMSFGNIPVDEFPVSEDGSSSQTFSSGIPLLTPQEQITHTLTISSGSSSRAFAGDGFLSHSLSLPSGSATSEEYITQYSSLPSVPPPLIPCTTSPTNNSPFTLAKFHSWQYSCLSWMPPNVYQTTCAPKQPLCSSSRVARVHSSWCVIPSKTLWKRILPL